MMVKQKSIWTLSNSCTVQMPSVWKWRSPRLIPTWAGAGHALYPFFTVRETENRRLMSGALSWPLHASCLSLTLLTQEIADELYSSSRKAKFCDYLKIGLFFISHDSFDVDREIIQEAISKQFIKKADELSLSNITVISSSQPVSSCKN